ncbi:hypothetical protein EVAR_86153_1 [Eumeta japonica]|uniref:Uncharacterized protein n=1 Tax=Eumeta variegata TaxID=151549 RepID=A0A4C1Z2L9_EUMVA|nr:hypothetical protein EVAR_86153_1 [Eumeta japonica]
MRCRSVSRSRCIKASEVHEVVVYENRGENLNYLLQRDPKDPIRQVPNVSSNRTGRKQKYQNAPKPHQQEPKKGEEGKEVDQPAAVSVRQLREHYANALSEIILLILEILKDLASARTVIIRTTAKHKLYASVPHAVVAIPRHTVSFIFYTDDGEVGIFVNRALAASDKKKKYHNNAKWLSLIRTEKSWISWKTDEEDSSTKTKLQAIP